ncbi:MATE family efflux transporter [Oceanirhabdus seepicola]|uniref:Multidrug export protein MepA n=1 Tax=Oceanirhabdus seepicola TaxID=2828781 RepID=A0A9J6P7F1_9CLOT|nr:MATE family efflux transporter [Oceanirhabdus seepicola]MCM1991432.1 MATE family efflux transporter [Oceanirhabdus seepicola]
MNENKLYLMEKEKPMKALLILSLPAVIAMLVNTVYNLTDTFFIGQLNDSSQVAAIAVTFPIFTLLSAVGIIFSTGGASLLSRVLGSKNYKKASKVAVITFVSCFTVSIVISIIVYIFLEPILMMCGTSEQTIGYALKYSQIIVGFNIFTLVNACFSGLLRAEGSTKESMNGLMIGTIANIIMDPIFIILLNWGVVGAAIATVIGKILSCIYYLSYYLRKKSIVDINLKDFSFDSKIYKEIFKIGIPASLSQFMMSLFMAFLNAVAVRFGDSVVAAEGIVMKIISVVFMILIGVSAGYQPLAGYNYGAENYNRFRIIIKKAIMLCSIISCISAVIFLLYSNSIIRIFIKDVDTVYYGSSILRYMSLSLPIIGAQIIMSITFQAAGKGLPTLILSLTRQGIFAIPLFILMPKLFGFTGFLLAQPISDILSFALTTIFFMVFLKNIKKDKLEPIESIEEISKIIIEEA